MEWLKSVTFAISSQLPPSVSALPPPPPEPIFERDNDTTSSPLLNEEIAVRATDALAAKHAKEQEFEQLDKLQIDRGYYSIPVTLLTIPRFQFVFESVQYDTHMNVGVDELTVDLSRNPITGDLCGRIDIGSIWGLPDEGFDPDNEQMLAHIVQIAPVACLYSEQQGARWAKAEVGKMTICVGGNDLARLKQFGKELQPLTGNKEELATPQAPNPVPLAFDARIRNLAADLRINGELAAKIGANNIGLRVRTQVDHQVETAITVGIFFIRNVRGEKPGECVSLWPGQSNSHRGAPFLRIQAKQGTQVGGISVFNHIEINLEPTVVNYDAAFFNSLIDFVLCNDIGASKFEQARCGLALPEYSCPEICVPMGLLPGMKDSLKEVLATHSREYETKVDRAEANFLLRYFKITTTRLNVSYFNPENKMVPQVTNFAGLLHDVILQDFTATMRTFIGELVSQISSDVIPQFIKHIFGLGKGTNKTEPGTVGPADLEKEEKRKKELLFGKTPKK